MNIKTVVLVLLSMLFIGCDDTKEQVTENHLPSQTLTIEDNSLVRKEIEYQFEGKKYKSYIAYYNQKEVKRPVVFILLEWWGITDYIRNRAEQIAGLGYLAVVVDMFGDGASVDTPEKAQAQTKPLVDNPDLAKQLFEVAVAEAKKLPETDENNMAAIGYCFGGAMVLNYAREGEPLKGVVSFHGNLSTGVKAKSNTVHVLALNGTEDSFISYDDIKNFKNEMEKAGIDYTFINYPGAEHSFTNPEATEIGQKFGLKVAYHKLADEASWEDMKNFLAEIFTNENKPTETK